MSKNAAGHDAETLPGHSTSEGGDPPTPSRSGRGAWMVIGACMVIGASLGVFLLFESKRGAETVVNAMTSARQAGASVDAETCVTLALDWHDKQCDAPGKMCLDAVPKLVGECLAAKDRTNECAALGNDEKPSQWAYHRCKARGVDKKSAKGVKESCTSAWRAFDSFCKSNQEGVAL
jgi:hypothetical protein